ncbi:MAG TPA: DUF975 family protein [Lachnospiraceae bacterium]|nr:DUF975 family protein [Lachnospiraceae bacterium]
MNKSSSSLKSLAKGQLLGHYSKLITAFIIIEFITIGILSVAFFTINQSTIFGMVIYYTFIFLLQLLTGVFLSGQARLYLNFCSKRNYSISDIFYGFKLHSDKAIMIELTMILTTAVCLFPFVVTLFLYNFTDELILIPIMTLLLLAGIVICCYRLLGLSQCFFIMQDFPDYSTKQIVSMSNKVMKGYKGYFFYVLVSFIPLYLLCLLTFGLGFLWIIPYTNAIKVNFYMDLMNCHSQKI